MNRINRINQLVATVSLSSVVLLLAACSKQESAPPGATAKPMEAVTATTAPVAKPAEPKAMDMPMSNAAPAASAKDTVHHVAAVVKGADAASGSVTLSHGPVATLNWPPMTMSFKVKDKTLMDQLSKDKKVEVDFVKDGSDYVVTAVR